MNKELKISRSKRTPSLGGWIVEAGIDREIIKSCALEAPYTILGTNGREVHPFTEEVAIYILSHFADRPAALALEAFQKNAAEQSIKILKECKSLISLTEAANIVGVTRRTVWNWVQSGRLPARQPSGKKRGDWRVKRSDLEKIIGVQE